MTSILSVEKVISTLPPTLISDTIYIVRVGSGFDFYVTDSTGSIAHSLNLSSDTPTTGVSDEFAFDSSYYYWAKETSANNWYVIRENRSTGSKELATNFNNSVSFDRTIAFLQSLNYS